MCSRHVRFFCRVILSFFRAITLRHRCWLKRDLKLLLITCSLCLQRVQTKARSMNMYFFLHAFIYKICMTAFTFFAYSSSPNSPLRLCIAYHNTTEKSHSLPGAFLNNVMFVSRYLQSDFRLRMNALE